MALTHSVASFKGYLPEFRNVPDSLIQDALDESLKMVDPELFEDVTVQATFYRAAHMLNLSGFGLNSKQTGTPGNSTYLEHYNRLRREVGAVGFRVC